ncbi:MAG: hypothetical protein GY737_29545, partial [Desulfobacteraceae bacterium]|nr:hypothetical protein [Desulfobacteraceae bacterium]
MGSPEQGGGYFHADFSQLRPNTPGAGPAESTEDANQQKAEDLRFLHKREEAKRNQADKAAQSLVIGPNPVRPSESKDDSLDEVSEESLPEKPKAELKPGMLTFWCSLDKFYAATFLVIDVAPSKESCWVVQVSPLGDGKMTWEGPARKAPTSELMRHHQRFDT